MLLGENKTIDSEDLINYIEPIQKNTENLNKLIENYSSEKTVAFVGSGVSDPLGIVDWKGLLKELINHCEMNFQNNSKQELDNSEQWPELADKIYYELQSKQKERLFYSVIRNKMVPSNNTTTLTLVKMIIAIKICLTTNFDRSIESAYEALDYLSKYLGNKEYGKPLIKYVPNFGEYLSQSKGIIYYLHGNISEDIYILRKTHYDKYYPSVSRMNGGSTSIEDCLKYFFKNKNIIFIGFSFADKYIRQYLLKLAKEIERENMINSSLFNEHGKVYNREQILHFLLIDSENNIWQKMQEQIFSEYEKYFILPIIYKSKKHIFIEKLFEYLSRRETSGI